VTIPFSTKDTKDGLVKTYLWTPEDLEREGTLLGSFRGSSYDDMQARAREVGLANGMGHPALGLTLRLRPSTGLNDQPYPVSPSEWDQFQFDEPSYCREPVRVYAFDGGKFDLRPRPPVVCLCGSTRFKDAFEAASRSETLAGRIVLSVGGIYGHMEGLDMGGPVKAMLDELHLRKIDMANEILVVSENGYIGQSTFREIEYAYGLGRPVRWVEATAEVNYRAIRQGSQSQRRDAGQDAGLARDEAAPAADRGDQGKNQAGPGGPRGGETAEGTEAAETPERVEVDRGAASPIG
jgi:hypothetical protein